MADSCIYLDTYVLQQDMRVRLPKAILSNMDIEKGKKYFTTRNDSSIIAFRVGNNLEHYSFNIATAHSDSPTYKLKENTELQVVKNHYMQLNTEGYGGMIDNTWFDRPLSIAGRVLVKEGDSFVSKLFSIVKTRRQDDIP